MRAYIEPFESFEEVMLSAQSCLEQAVSIHDDPAAAASLILLGAITEDQGDFKTAIQHYQKAMQFHPLLDDVYFTNIRIALCYQALKEFSQAIQVFRLCLQRGRETGEQVKTAWSLFNIGETLLMLGNPAEAEDYLEQACALFEKVGTTLGLAWCKYCSSRAAIALGDYTRGRELAEAANKFAHQIHYASGIAKTEKFLQEIDPKYSQGTSDMKSQREEPLSVRELEVLHLLRSDLSGPDIAQKLVVSLNTIRYHTKNIYRKLGAGSRLEALERARELGL
jgi:ATP/maltotriose-dependent transcriptional regulator MalT